MIGEISVSHSPNLEEIVWRLYMVVRYSFLGLAVEQSDAYCFW